MRLNKFISDSGKASRRGADKLIAEGRVKVNGRIAKIGDQVKPGDEVMVNGNIIRLARNHVYLALNKPVGITCTTEKGVKGNIVDLVNHPLRVFNIGRLDKDSDGLILLTNDGDIVNEILRAENNHEKETDQRPAGRHPGLQPGCLRRRYPVHGHGYQFRCRRRRDRR